MDSDVRVSVARREATEFHTEIRLGALIMTFVWSIPLLALAYFDVATKWLLVCAFFETVMVLTGITGSGIKRLDTRLSYIEQICTGLDQRA